MTDVDIHHLGAAYALDALDERERMAFEAHYPSCDVCRADVSDFRSALAQLAGASTAAPSTSVRAAVMAEIAQTRQLSPMLPDSISDLAERRRRQQRTYGGALAMAAAVVLAFVTGAMVTGGDEAPAYATDLEFVLAHGDARMVTLGSTGATGSSADGSVKVAWSDEGERMVLLANGLPGAPDGQAYELWLIGADGSVPLRMLDDASEGSIRSSIGIGTGVGIDSAPRAWGITLEPSGGSDAPTGDILYLTDV